MEALGKPTDEPRKRALARRLLPLAAVAVVFPVLVPCWVVVLPRLAFDVDPRTPGADLVTTLGPAAFGWLACFGVLASAVAMALHVLAGGALRWGSAVLVMVGIGAVALHAPGSFENLWHGVGWVWAASAGLAAVHLGAWPNARRWAALLLAGLAGALLVEAAYFVWVEHAETVRQFERNRDVFLESRGWAEGSPEATLYERRLRTDDAVGAFGLSNVLGTLAAALSVMGLGMATAVPAGPSASWRDAWRPLRTRHLGRHTAGLAVFACGLVTVFLTNSSGALMAWFAGVAWVTAAVLLRMWRARRTDRDPGDGRPWAFARGGSWPLSALAIGCVALVFVGVLLRGALGPPEPGQIGRGIAGELSVLFRFHYWEAAVRMIGATWEQGGFLGVLPGVGVTGFGMGYLIHKNPLNPEEVTNAHAVFVDYPVMLGLGGLAWSAVLLGWLWRGSSAAASLADGSAETPAAAEVQPQETRILFYAVLGLAVVLFGGEAVIAWPEVQTLSPLMMRLGAAGAFVALAVAWGRFAPRSSGGLRVALTGATLVALVHGQFDMAFFQPASAPVLWVIVGLCGWRVVPRPDGVAGSPGQGSNSRTAPGARTHTHRRKARVPAGLVAAASAVVVLWISAAALNLSAYQRGAWQAAAALRVGDLVAAEYEIRNVSRSVRFDPVLVRAYGLVLHETASQRSLNAAYPVMPWRYAVVDFVLLERWKHFDDGTAIAYAYPETDDRLVDELAFYFPPSDGPEPGSPGTEDGHAGTARLSARLIQAWLDASSRHRINGVEGPERAAVLLWAIERVLVRSPYSVRDWVWLGDTHVRVAEIAGFGTAEADAHRQRAVAAYREALRLDAQRYLDPGKQLDGETRTRVGAWLQGNEDPAGEASG